MAQELDKEVPISASMEFTGFEPGTELRSLAKDILWKIEANSPGNSAQQINISKSRRGFRAEVKISSVAGMFFAETESKTPELALADIQAKIGGQLIAWKKQRFSFC